MKPEADHFSNRSPRQALAEAAGVAGERMRSSADADRGSVASGRSAGESLTLSDVMRLVSSALLIIRLKWIWGVLTAVLVVALGAYAILRRPADYTARTLLLARGALDEVIAPRPGSTRDAQELENTLRNHLSVMNSRKFRARLAASFTPPQAVQVTAPFLKPGESHSAAKINDILEGAVRVERERGREFFNVQVTHRDPDTALLIAGGFAAEYLELVKRESREANKMGFALLQKQAAALREEIARLEEERLNFRKKNQIISLAENKGMLGERLRRLDVSRLDNRVRSRELSAQLAQARSEGSQPEKAWHNPYLATFGNNAQLRQELDRLLAQRAVLAGRYGPAHPRLRDLEASIKGVEQTITKNIETAITDLDAQLAVLAKNDEQLRIEFDDAFQRSIELEKLASRYEILGTDVAAKRQTLEGLQRRLGDAGVISELPNDFMQIVDAPFLVQPRVPRHLVQLALLLMCGIGVFVVTPLAAHLLDPRVNAASDIEQTLGLALLGAIPRLKVRSAARAHIVRDQRDYLVSEAFLALGSRIDISSDFASPKVILVTSTVAKEGKSTLTSNLASAFARLGKRTAIVDMDLRRPSQNRLHGGDGNLGFRSWTRAGCPRQNLLDAGGPLGVQRLADGVHLIPAGTEEESPGNLLASRAVELLIEALSSHFDVILIDTAPAGLFQDALVLSRHVQFRLLVTRVATAKRAQVEKVIADFERSRLGFSGMVLNGFSLSAAHHTLTYGYDANALSYAAPTRKGRGSKVGPLTPVARAC